MNTPTQHPNPHQPWCDLDTCLIDEDLSTAHFGHEATTEIGECSTLTTQLYRSSDGTGTGVFVEYRSESHNTPEHLEQLAHQLLALAAKVRELP